MNQTKTVNTVENLEIPVTLTALAIHVRGVFDRVRLQVACIDYYSRAYSLPYTETTWRCHSPIKNLQVYIIFRLDSSSILYYRYIYMHISH